jgi:hypothetical protein
MLAQSIQNGTHPSAPSNPVLKDLDDLQTEVEDIVMGFETRLQNIKRDGQRTLGADEQMEGYDPASSPESKYSILPVPDDDGFQTDTPVVIGKSKAQVLEALGQVESEQTEPEIRTSDSQEGRVKTSEEFDKYASAHVEL